MPNVKELQSKTKTGLPVIKGKIDSVIPKHREKLLKWNGWGYKDSKFIIKEDEEVIAFIGNRYPIGNRDLPYFTEWVKNKFNITLDNIDTFRRIAKPLPKPEDYPVPMTDHDFISKLDEKNISYSSQGLDRLVRSHGHALHDIVQLRELNFDKQRIPDLVVWPQSHDDVAFIVKEATERNIILIPFGGGTSVSWAVSCPEYEKRMFVSLDTSQMNRLLWLDEQNLVACFEAGVIGQDLERVLQHNGFTSGHEPDSYEFSSLGGWVATRASGMKKNTYGNIEDLLVSVKMVTPAGVLHRKCQVPRMSCGPDFNHVIMGSEGTLGVITEVAIKIRPLPRLRKYGSIVFPDFDSGFNALREIARKRYQPSSIRLMDNEQFKFGQSLRPVPSYFGILLDGLKKVYITKIKRFNVDRMCVTTLLFEGSFSTCRNNLMLKLSLVFNGVCMTYTFNAFESARLSQPKYTYIREYKMIRGTYKIGLPLKPQEWTVECMTALILAGEEKEVEIQEKRIYKIAVLFGGVPAGEKNGEQGYTLTFVIAYIRDLALDFNIIAESFETSVPWDRALSLCRNVKHRVTEECKRHGITHFLISARVTQTYDIGCCIYFYFGFNGFGLNDPLKVYGEIEDAAREEILAVGGSISHHHGIGKVRSKWYPQQISKIGVQLYELTKAQLDPKNIFANGNLLSPRSHL